MLGYSFDISYDTTCLSKLTDATVFELTDQFPSCVWYTSDITQTKVPQLTDTHNLNLGVDASKNDARCFRNNAFRVESADDLISIIQDVNGTKGLFISLVAKDLGNDERRVIFSKFTPSNVRVSGPDVKIRKLCENKN